jgi:hypothetical protein
MKKIFIIAIIICVSTVYSSATDHNSTIYTKCGQSIEVKILDELTPSQIQAFHDSITLRFPEATILDDATQTYNCHSFAWNLSDGGSTICWINQFNDLGQPNLSKYWTNDYYEETTEANAVKVFYYQSDHSAIVSPTVSGMYESKWGAWPLVRHAPGYGPYKKMYLRKYYAHFAPTPVYGSLQCSNISNSIGVNVSASYIAGSVPNFSTPYSYTITDNKGEDAIDNGKAVVNQVYFNGLNIAFTHTGIYEIVISFKNQFNEYLGDYSYEQIVQ